MKALIQRGAGAAFLLLTLVTLAAAQEVPVARLVAEPAKIVIKAGETQPFKVTAYDAQGRVIPNAQIRVSGPRRALSFSDDMVFAREAGNHTAVATSVAAPGATPVTLEIPVTVTWPAVSKIEIAAEPGRLYRGATLAHSARVLHADNSVRKDAVVAWRSSNPAVARVDRFGNVTGLAVGSVVITAESEAVSAQKQYTVATNPVASIELQIKESKIWTGDVIHLAATPKRANGTAVSDAPITWSYTYSPDDTLFAAGGAGIIERDVFAANQPGRFTLIAHVGNTSARTVVEVKTREVKRRISVVGRGNITNTHTSDLWPWTGKDGRDYVLVGTWGGDGYGIVFDITDINNPVKTDSVKVDARTINDVTISPDGRYGVLSREGASNRVNGVVILDLANPAHPKVASTFSQELTGGVHNMFATNDYLFAVSGGAEVRHHRCEGHLQSEVSSVSTGIPTRACTTSGCTTASPTRRRAAWARSWSMWATANTAAPSRSRSSSPCSRSTAGTRSSPTSRRRRARSTCSLAMKK